jgi:hypothetical protein
MAKDIDPKLKLISEYLNLDKKEYFVIPEYQRGYSWDITQCDKLWQDIEAFIDSGATDPYFFGTIIIDCSEDKKFSLIDGQQRTTTFLLLLKSLLINLMDVLGKFSDDTESEKLKAGLEGNRNKIIRILYKAEDEDRVGILKDWDIVKETKILDNNSINEQHKDEIKTILKANGYESAEHHAYKIPRKQKDNKYTNHFRNFKFFYDKLSDKSESQLNVFAKIFLNKCQIIEIRSWQIEQAITMFNSLNSTGMPLSDADIISAQLYSRAGTDKKIFNEKWESINTLAQKLNIRNIVDINSVLQQFMYINRAINKEYISGDSVDVTTPGLRRYYMEIKKELSNEPLKLCENLAKITEIWDKIQDYPIIKLLLKFNENVKLYLLGYLYRLNPKDITKERVLDVAECLLRLFTILELVDSGYSSKNFKTFLFSENVKLVDNDITLDTIKNDFNNHISKNWAEEDIEELIKEYDKNILVYLNEYLYSKSKGGVFNLSENVNIEHIMPSSGSNIQSIMQDAGINDVDEFKSVVNKIGNKILLEENINKSLGNDWFRTKKQTSINDKTGYKDSSYSIAKALTSYPKDIWKKNDIEEMTKKVAERIVAFVFNKKI